MRSLGSLFAVLSAAALVALGASSALAGSTPSDGDVFNCNYNDDETNDLAFGGDGSNRSNVIEDAGVTSTGFFGNGGNAWQIEGCARVVPGSTTAGGPTGSGGLISEGVSGSAANFTRVEQLSSNGTVIENTVYGSLGGGSWDYAGSADVDGDGIDDLVYDGVGGTAGEPFYKVEILLGANAGTVIFGASGGGSFKYEGTGDVDADGDQDLFFVTTDGTVLRIDIYENAAIDSSTFTALGDGSFEITAIGDVTGDDKADLVQNSAASAKIVQLEDGVTTGTLFTANGGNTLVPNLLADTEGNGGNDVIYVGDPSSRIDLMNEDSLGVESSAFLPNLGYDPVLTGDYDGDGDGDIAGESGVGVRFTLLNGASAEGRSLNIPNGGGTFDLVTE